MLDTDWSLEKITDYLQSKPHHKAAQCDPRHANIAPAFLTHCRIGCQ